MKKKIILLMVMIFTTILLSANQTPPEIEWYKTFGGSGEDMATSIIQTTDGGFAVAGYTYSKGAGDADFWIVKLDENGKKIWDETFGGSDRDKATSIIQTKDGGFAVAGYTVSKGAGSADFWVVKLDEYGKKIWDKIFGGNSWDSATSIIQTKDGGFAVAGDTSSKGAGYCDFWVVKLDKNGKKLWDKTFGGSSADVAHSIIQTKDCGFAVAGRTWSKGGGEIDFWVVKLDENGKKIWDKTFGGSKLDEAYSIIQTTDGGFAVAGWTLSKGAGEEDFWVIKLKGEESKITAPPFLVTNNILFKEPSGNNTLDGYEQGSISFIIENKGKGTAHKVRVLLENRSAEKNITFNTIKEVGDILPNTSKEIIIPIKAAETVSTSLVAMKISVKEANGFDASDINLTFNTRAYQPPELCIAGIGIADDGTGESIGNGNYKIEYAEIIEVSFFIQNRGKGKAENVRVNIKIDDENIFLLSNKSNLNLGKIETGNYKKVSFPFTVNKRFEGKNLPISLVVSEEKGKYGIIQNLGLEMGEVTLASKDIEITPIKEKEIVIKELPGTMVDVDIDIPKTDIINKDAVAVVIGNRNYSKKDVPKVDFANRDANYVKEYLINTLGYREGNIIYVTDASQADFNSIFGTDKNYKGRLYNYVKSAQSDIFIYYSGHGAPDPESKNGYFVPVDCDPSLVSLNGYSLNTFYDNLSKINYKSLTVVIDACFSGASEAGMLLANISPVFIKVENPITSKENSVIFTSATGEQVSSWYPEKKHSLFTYYFLKALQGEADKNNNKQLTIDEIKNYIDDKVPYMARRLNNREQTPQVIGNLNKVVVKY